MTAEVRKSMRPLSVRLLLSSGGAKAEVAVQKPRKLQLCLSL